MCTCEFSVHQKKSEPRTQNSFPQSCPGISQAHRVVPAAKSSQTEKRQADLELDKYGLLNDVQIKPCSCDTASTIESLRFGQER